MRNLKEKTTNSNTHACVQTMQTMRTFMPWIDSCRFRTNENVSVCVRAHLCSIAALKCRKRIPAFLVVICASRDALSKILVSLPSDCEANICPAFVYMGVRVCVYVYV